LTVLELRRARRLYPQQQALLAVQSLGLLQMGS